METSQVATNNNFGEWINDISILFAVRYLVFDLQEYNVLTVVRPLFIIFFFVSFIVGKMIGKFLILSDRYIKQEKFIQ